jgi:hypothetical protein
MTQEEALAILWKNKDWKSHQEGWVEKFIYATLLVDATMHFSDEITVPRGREIERVAPKGSTVLVTMVSRFGDVGIRDDRLVPPSNGYYCRVMPEQLTDWREAP